MRSTADQAHGSPVDGWIKNEQIYELLFPLTLPFLQWRPFLIEGKKLLQCTPQRYF